MATLFLIEMTVTSLDRSLAWYSLWLDTAPAVLDRTNGFALFEPDGVRLSLKQGTPVLGSTLLTFEVESLDLALARLASAGIHSEGTIKVSSEGYHRAKFRDPDGQPVSLFAWLPDADQP